MLFASRQGYVPRCYHGSYYPSYQVDAELSNGPNQQYKSRTRQGSHTASTGQRHVSDPPKG